MCVFAHLIWNSWMCDNRAAACCKERIWMCFLQSPPVAAEGQTPAWRNIGTHTHTHWHAHMSSEHTDTFWMTEVRTYILFFYNLLFSREEQHQFVYQHNFRHPIWIRDRSKSGLCEKYINTYCKICRTFKFTLTRSCTESIWRAFWCPYIILNGWTRTKSIMTRVKLPWRVSSDLVSI